MRIPGGATVPLRLGERLGDGLHDRLLGDGLHDRPN